MASSKRPGGPYVTPLLTDDGSEAVPAGARGKFTLTALKTYVFVLGGSEAPRHSAHIEWDAAIVITSINVEDCNADKSEVSDYSTTNGAWITENPPDAYIPVEGAGASVLAATVAVTGGAVGGCMFHLEGTAARRTRITMVVGATGGVARVSAHGKA